MEDSIGRDAMAWVCLIEDDIQCRVASTINQFQTLVGVLIHHDEQ
jgi:hypothetical protein